MAEVLLSVGTRVFVAADKPTTYAATGTGSFASLPYTEVGEVTNLGEFGGSAQVTQHVPLKTGIIAKRKGSIDYGTAALQIGRLPGDAGQAILKAGFDGTSAYDVHSFKIVAVDGQAAYFTGVIGSYVTSYGDANTVTAVSCNVELDNKVLEATVTPLV